MKEWRVGQQQGEPRVRPRPGRPEERLNALYERGESVLTSVVALFIMGFVVVALVAVIAEVRRPLFVDHDFSLAALKGIDAAFLAIILLELLHTTLSRGPISQQLQEFLVIGITAAVRHGLELAASGRGSNPRDVVINLVLNSVGAVVLVGGLWLVRQQLRADRRAQREDELGRASRPAAEPSDGSVAVAARERGDASSL